MGMLDQRTEKRSTYHLQDRLAGPRRNTISTKGWLFLVFVSTSAVGQLHRNACQANRIRGDPPTQLCATLIHKLCKVRTVLLSLTKQWMDVYTAETSQFSSYLMNYLLGRLQTICISTRKQRSDVAIELTKQWWIVQHPFFVFPRARRGWICWFVFCQPSQFRSIQDAVLVWTDM